jgi:hypothetical protein
MPKSVLICLILSVLGFPFFSFGQKGSWVEFKKDNYSIKFPENWTLDSTHKSGTDFIILSPQSSEEDAFKENLNLVVQDLSGLNFDLYNFTQLSEQQIQNYMDESELIENERLKKGQQEYQHLVYTAKNAGHVLRFEQYYWIINEKAYVLSFTAELTEFENYKDISKRILDSFVIK